jgi:anti-sigma-K factor RskA
VKHDKQYRHEKHDRHDITCEELKDMAAAYALGALDEADRIACTQHLARSGPHHGCASAVEDARRVIARLAASVPPLRPSPVLWHSIASRIVSILPTAIERRRRLRTPLRSSRAKPPPHAHR